MSKSLQIEIANEENEENFELLELEQKPKSFLEELKETLSEFSSLEKNDVITFVKSDEFKDEREKIEQAFWDIFSEISSEDDSLDSAILLQSYGFYLSKPVKETTLEEKTLETTLEE